MIILAITALIVLGIILLLLELFVIPGITIAGIAGGILLLSGIYISFEQFGVVGGTISIAITAVLSLSALFLAFKSNTWKRISLNKAIESKVNVLEIDEVMVGDKAVAISRLAPMGKILLNEKYYEARTLNGIIDEQSEVEVIKVEKGRITVKPITKLIN